MKADGKTLAWMVFRQKNICYRHYSSFRFKCLTIIRCNMDNTAIVHGWDWMWAFSCLMSPPTCPSILSPSCCLFCGVSKPIPISSMLSTNNNLSSHICILWTKLHVVTCIHQHLWWPLANILTDLLNQIPSTSPPQIKVLVY